MTYPKLCISILTCAILCAGVGPLSADTTVYPATLSQSCAPWDGAAMSLVVKLPAQDFKAQIYGEGLEDLQDGEKFTLTGQASAHNGTGMAMLCDRSILLKCTEINATIEIPEPDKDGLYGQGRIILPLPSGEMIYQIAPTLNTADRVLCG